MIPFYAMVISDDSSYTFISLGVLKLGAELTL
jgi:hypothetical protein